MNLVDLVDLVLYGMVWRFVGFVVVVGFWWEVFLAETNYADRVWNTLVVCEGIGVECGEKESAS